MDSSTNLRPCPACGHQVSRNAAACPVCGDRLGGRSFGAWVGICLGVLVALAAIGAALSAIPKDERHAWRRPSSREEAVAIAREIVAGKLRDCGTFYVRVAPENPDLYFIACSSNLVTWWSYKADVSDDLATMTGPPFDEKDKRMFDRLANTRP